MILVIFGAGASYDSVPSRPLAGFPRERINNRPPLAAELFSSIEFFANCRTSFPRCQPIVTYLQDIPNGQTVESVLERLQQEAEDDPERKCQVTAIRYYLQTLLRQCQHDWLGITRFGTNYITLIE